MASNLQQIRWCKNCGLWPQSTPLYSDNFIMAKVPGTFESGSFRLMQSHLSWSSASPATDSMDWKLSQRPMTVTTQYIKTILPLYKLIVVQ